MIYLGLDWAAGYCVFEINPLAASRYRDRHHLSGAKSDRGDAKMLADVVRTDRHNHRPYTGNSDLAEGVKLLARAHQSLIHDRQTQVNHLRTTLRQYYPGLLLAFPAFASPSERDSRDAMAVLERAPTPAQGRRSRHHRSARPCARRAGDAGCRCGLRESATRCGRLRWRRPQS